MTQLPWTERVPMLSIHPDAASRDDVARLATELMEANQRIGVCEDCGKPLTIVDTVCQPCQDKWEAQQDAKDAKAAGRHLDGRTRDSMPETGKEQS